MSPLALTQGIHREGPVRSLRSNWCFGDFGRESLGFRISDLVSWGLGNLSFRAWRLGRRLRAFGAMNTQGFGG